MKDRRAATGAGVGRRTKREVQTGAKSSDRELRETSVELRSARLCVVECRGQAVLSLRACWVVAERSIGDSFGDRAVSSRGRWVLAVNYSNGAAGA